MATTEQYRWLADVLGVSVAVPAAAAQPGAAASAKPVAAAKPPAASKGGPKANGPSGDSGGAAVPASKAAHGAGPAPAARDLTLRITAAQDRFEKALAFYHSTRSGAQYAADMTGGVDDPGAKIEKAVAEVHKNAPAALAAVKGGDLAKATKLAEAIEARARDASGLASTYAVAVDHAVVTTKTDRINTPWGQLVFQPQQAASITSVAVTMSKIPESDKTLVAKYQSSLKAQQDAVKPLAEYIATPGKLEKEIEEAASDQAVNWAEHTGTNEEIAKLKDIFNANLISQIETARTQWQAAQTELDSTDLKEKAASLRAKAEKADKLLDFAIDLFKGAVEIVATGGEGAAVAAAEAFTGALKFFNDNDFKKEAEEAEKEAAALHRESVTAVFERAKKATDELTAQLEQIGPLSLEVTGSIERNATRATKQFDKDCGSHPNCKFRFGDVQATIQKVIPLVQATRKAADERFRNAWQPADALLGVLLLNLGKIEVDRGGGNTKEVQFDQSLSNNRGVTNAMRAAIDKSTAECHDQARSASDVITSLLALQNRAMGALKRARV
jgi:hypothetical protein